MTLVTIRSGFLQSPFGPAPAGDRGVEYQGDPSSVTIEAFMYGVVLDLEGFWRTTFEAAGLPCAFTGPERLWVAGDASIAGPCGRRTSASTGAFYCADGDRHIIVVGDRWMYEQIFTRHGQHAQFAVASVLAHEMGHHVQDSLGLLRTTLPRRCCGLERINVELHADCLAGLWARSVYGREVINLDAMEQAISAAEEAGDLPESTGSLGGFDTSYRHGSPEQRRAWFSVGAESTGLTNCVGALQSGL